MAAFIYKQCSYVRTVLYLSFLAVFLLFPVMAAAQLDGGDVARYTVEGVEVDATAENAVKAREKALSEAQVKAYEILVERLMTDGQAAPPIPDADTVSLMVQDFEVMNEQLSRVRYKGTFTIRFRPNLVTSQLAGYGGGHGIEGSAEAGAFAAGTKPVLILPFYQLQGSTILWREDNPWMRAWRTVSPSQSAGRAFITPRGGTDEAQLIADHEAMTHSPVRVQQLAARYNADDVFILVAAYEALPDGARRLSVNIYRHRFEGPAFIRKVEIGQLPSETAEALFARAAVQLRNVLAQDIQNAPSFARPAPAYSPRTAGGAYQQPQAQAPTLPYTRQAQAGHQTYTATARFTNVQEWMKLKNAIDRAPGVQQVFVKTLRPREALLDIRFAGTAAQMQSSFHGAGVAARNSGPNAPVELSLPPRFENPYRF